MPLNMIDQGGKKHYKNLILLFVYKSCYPLNLKWLLLSKSYAYYFFWKFSEQCCTTVVWTFQRVLPFHILGGFSINFPVFLIIIFIMYFLINFLANLTFYEFLRYGNVGFVQLAKLTFSFFIISSGTLSITVLIYQFVNFIESCAKQFLIVAEILKSILWIGLVTVLCFQLHTFQGLVC